VLRQAIGRAGGTEVKSIGDALIVSYPAAADAIADADAMQQGVDLHNRRCDGARLAMRVGISAGDASFEDGDWFGTPVVEASRLRTAADGGWNDGVVMGSVPRQRSGRRAQRSRALPDWSAGSGGTPSRPPHVVRRMPSFVRRWPRGTRRSAWGAHRQNRRLSASCGPGGSGTIGHPDSSRKAQD
jgi:hypothetical protein